jgi:hypothetical protein
MLNRIFNAIFGGDADETHLFGSSFKERIEEGIELFSEGIEDIAKSLSSFGDDVDDDKEEGDSKEQDEEVEIIEP